MPLAKLAKLAKHLILLLLLISISRYAEGAAQQVWKEFAAPSNNTHPVGRYGAQIAIIHDQWGAEIMYQFGGTRGPNPFAQPVMEASYGVYASPQTFVQRKNMTKTDASSLNDDWVFLGNVKGFNGSCVNVNNTAPESGLYGFSLVVHERGHGDFTIYLFGGEVRRPPTQSYENTFIQSNALWAFSEDFETGEAKWTLMNPCSALDDPIDYPLPAPRYGASAIELDGDVVITGGATFFNDMIVVHSPLSDIWRFNVTTGKWVELAGHAPGLFLAGHTKYEGKMYLFGGYRTYNMTEEASPSKTRDPFAIDYSIEGCAGLWVITFNDDNSVYVEELSSNSKSIASNISPVFDAFLGAIGGRLFVVGGETAPTDGYSCQLIKRQIFYYTLATNTWKAFANPPSSAKQPVPLFMAARYFNRDSGIFYQLGGGTYGKCSISQSYVVYSMIDEYVDQSMFQLFMCDGGHAPDTSTTGRCVGCSAGFHLPMNDLWSSECKSCPINTYNPSTAAFTCAQCLPNSVTADVESVSSLNCTCQTGYYGTAGVCTACPTVGATCPGGTEFPLAMAGYYVDTLYPSVIRECAVKAACLGGAPSSAQKCATGYSGYLCSACTTSPMYYRLKNECIPCPKDNNSALVGLIAFGAVAVLVAIGMFFMSIRSQASDMAAGLKGIKNVSKVKKAFGTFSIVLGSIQISSLFLTFDLQWPDFLKDALRVFSIANLNIEMVAPECTVQMDFFTKFILYMAVPLGFFAIFFVLVSIEQIVLLFMSFFSHKDKVKPADIELNTVGEMVSTPAAEKSRGGAFIKLIPLVFTTSNLAYVMISSKVFDFFNCVEDPADKMYHLVSEYSTLCYEGQWLSHLPYAIGGLLIYVIGLPVAWFLILYFQFKNKRENSMTAIKKYGMMHQRYESRFYYWEVAIMMRKMSLACIVALFAAQALFQAVTGIIIIFLALLAHVFSRPYEEVVEDRLEFSSLFVAFITLFSGLVFTAPTWPTEEQKLIAGYVVTIIVIIATLFSVIVALSQISKMLHEKLGNLFRKCCGGKTEVIEIVAESTQETKTDVVSELDQLVQDLKEKSTLDTETAQFVTDFIATMKEKQE